MDVYIWFCGILDVASIEETILEGDRSGRKHLLRDVDRTANFIFEDAIDDIDSSVIDGYGDVLFRTQIIQTAEITGRFAILYTNRHRLRRRIELVKYNFHCASGVVLECAVSHKTILQRLTRTIWLEINPIFGWRPSRVFEDAPFDCQVGCRNDRTALPMIVVKKTVAHSHMSVRIVPGISQIDAITP